MELFKVVRVVQVAQVEKVLTNCFWLLTLLKVAPFFYMSSRLSLDPSSCFFFSLWHDVVNCSSN